MSNADGGLTTIALEYLAHCPDIWAERCNSGKVPTRGGYVQLSEPGTPDIRGYIKRAGRYALPFGLETKAKGGKLNDDQKSWHRKADAWGFPVFTCDNMVAVQEAIRMLREM